MYLAYFFASLFLLNRGAFNSKALRLFVEGLLAPRIKSKVKTKLSLLYYSKSFFVTYQFCEVILHHQCNDALSIFLINIIPAGANKMQTLGIVLLRFVKII